MKLGLNKNQKGITLISLVVVIILIFIIVGTLIYNAVTGVTLRKLNRMYNDIETLSDKITTYYAQYGAIPIRYDASGNAIDISTIVRSTIANRDANDNDTYYVLELSNLKGISLNYGKDYEKISSATDVKSNSDIYVINEQSHKVYYLKGIKFEGTMYYTETLDTEQFINSIAGRTYYEDTKIKVNGKTVLVPAGFTISGCTGIDDNLLDETTVSTGLVIYRITDNAQIDWKSSAAVTSAQKKYDQFVWVPVDNAVVVDSNGDGNITSADITTMVSKGEYPMAIATGTYVDDEGYTITNYKGIFYNFSSGTNGVSISYNSGTDYIEPAYLSGVDDDKSYNDAEPSFSEDSLQMEFNNMVESVKENGGFWVARYETSNMTTSTAQDTETNVTFVKGASNGISGVNWYRMYAQQKNYSVTKLSSEDISTDVTSSMIWGSQWDQIMIWMKDVKNESQNSYYIINSVGMGNYDVSGVSDGASGIATTGYSEITKVKNVYDLAGNVYAWTLEVTKESNNRILRGGCYVHTQTGNMRASSIIGTNPSSENSVYNGSRTTLY